MLHSHKLTKGKVELQYSLMYGVHNSTRRVDEKGISGQFVLGAILHITNRWAVKVAALTVIKTFAFLYSRIKQKHKKTH